MIRKCKICDEEFNVPPKEIKKGGGKYCSRKCHGISRRKKPNCECAYCGKAIHRKPSLVKTSKHKHFFCCREHKDAFGQSERSPWRWKKRDEDVKTQKQKAVDYKGGKCERCNYKSEYMRAYHFHHCKGEKEDGVSRLIMTIGIWDIIKKEIDKCKLLCANCHAEIHDGAPFIRKTKTY